MSLLHDGFHDNLSVAKMWKCDIICENLFIEGKLQNARKSGDPLLSTQMQSIQI